MACYCSWLLNVILERVCNERQVDCVQRGVGKVPHHQLAWKRESVVWMPNCSATMTAVSRVRVRGEEKKMT